MNKMLQISSLDQQPEANHWIGNVTTTLTSLLSSSLTFNKPESPEDDSCRLCARSPGVPPQGSHLKTVEHIFLCRHHQITSELL